MPVLDGASGAVSKELHHEVDDMTTNSDRNSDSEWELSRTSLNKALVDNRSLQAKIFTELESIAQKKRDNRLEAEKCIAESCAILLPPHSNQPSDPTDETPKPKRKLKRPPKGHPRYIPTNKDVNELIAFDNSQDDDSDSKPDEKSESKKVWTAHLRKKFKFDPFRKWTPEYFTDPTGSYPKDNEDSIRRRELMMKASSLNGSEQNDEMEPIPDTFFYHTAQPFTPKEKALLGKDLFQDGNNNANHINKWDDASNTFYQDLAKKLRQEHHEDALERWKDKAIFSTCLPRSADDIQMYHKDCLVSRYEFTKDESLAILEGVEEAATKSAQQSSNSDSEESTPIVDTSNEENDGPDWHKICDRVLDVHKRRQNISEDASDVFVPITPYQCMVHYKRKLRAQPDGSFTPEEDELILRYIAAMGPQFVWEYPQIADLVSRLFPLKSSRRLYERTLFSQWHPLAKDKPWTKDEEMKLVLAMKVYNGSNNNNNEDEAGASTQGQEKARLEKAALRKTSAHFHPYRQSYKVGKKWDRSFSPRFNYKPFSPQDDARLLAAVRSSSKETHFSEIAKKHFPDRSSDQLYQRWSNIATEKEVIERYVPKVMRSGLKRGLLSTKKGALMEREAANATSNNDPNGADGLFDPSDFVVEVVGDETKSAEN